MELAVIASIIGAVGQYEQGQSTKRMYDLKAKQASVEGERKSIQYQQQANLVIRKTIEDRAALNVRAQAGGVSAFSGSPLSVATANLKMGGRAFENQLQNAEAALRAGETQAAIYEQAGDAAGRAGTFSAIASLGSTYMGYSKFLGSGTPAPITTAGA